MRKATRASAGLRIGLAFWFGSTLGLFSACSQSDKKEPSACASASCAASGPALDFSKGDASYTAHIRVLDASGKPLEKADVQVGKSKGTTDADGRVSIKSVNAKASTVVQVAYKDAAPHVGTTDAFLSGQRTQTLSLAPLAFNDQVDLSETVTVQKDFGRLELEPNTIADKNGTRVGKARLQVADLGSSKDARDALGASFKALDKTGAPTTLKSLDAVTHVRLTDASGAELNLATTKAATLELALPKESKAGVGDVLSLWSLDQQSATLHEEGSCVVNAGESGRVCKGHVPHFSIWALGEAAPDLPLQCLNTQVTVDVPSCFKVEIERVFVESCDGAGNKCHEAPFQQLALSAAGSAVPASCGVIADSPTQRVVTLYDVDASGCAGTDKQKSGRRIKRGDAKVTPSQDARTLLSAFASSTSRLCSDSCGARELRIGLSDLDSAVILDRDDDGFYAQVDGELAAGSADCDDADARTFPAAPELFCSDKDLNCDGEAGREVDEATFNASCALCGVKDGAEVPGNLRDENCDGVAEDRDGDGVSEPEDCDDFSAESAPGLSEIAGNQRDEDCDGVAADFDGDGALSSLHLYLAARLGLLASAFGDCDDYDASIFPAASAKSEAGALASYFSADTRSAGYCDLFDGTGQPTGAFHALMVDRNCDGKVTDADGDGYAAVGDLTLGAALASDCDDFDPRVHVAEAGGSACASGVTLNDERTCRAPVYTPQCPAIGLSGGFVQTTCEESLDRGVGTGNGVCAFLGWSDGDPLTLEPGRLWGPCDGAGPLPECPAGAQCGGPLPLSSEIVDYLESTYTMEKPLAYKGMCFPKCAL